MKARQFCSVCKQWLDMEVVPTGDGDEDDGVIWFRCPQCQGFLPKLGGADLAPGAGTVADDPASTAAAVGDDGAEDLPWDSPADMMAARDAGESTDDVLRAAGTGVTVVEDEDEDLPDGADTDLDDVVDDGKTDKETAKEASDPVAEYAAMLAALDPTTGVPYRPSVSYAVGQCVHHLAWDDCGVVVAKESLPGGRRVIKCYFESAGVVRLIEEAPE